MPRRSRALSFFAFAAPALFASALSAQQPAGAAKPAAAAPAVDPCPIDLMQPTGLGIANLQRSKLASVKTQDEANKVMKDADKLLFDEKQKTNPLGRDLLLAEFVTFDIQFGDSAKRGDVGFPGDKNQYVDLFKFADSLFTLVETAEPKCKNTILAWRNFKPYTDRIRAAYAAVQTAPDSAEKLAQRAMILNHTNPQAYDVLWRVAQKRGDEAHEISYLQMAADKLEGDTLNATVRSNFLFTLGRIQQEFADAKTDKAQKEKYYIDAAKAFQTVLKEFPTGQEAPYAMQGIAISANAITGINPADSTIARAMTNDAVATIKANMDKYDDATLAQAGVLSTASGKTADAVMFFGAAAKLNPYFRDYQYNLAAMMYENKQAADIVPIVHKLVAMDPDNPDDLQLFTFGFKGVSDATKDPAVKKAAIDSVMYYGTQAEQLPMRVSYADFERQTNRTLLVGTVENRSKAARSYTIDFEFLGKDGSVLQKQSVTVDNVAPGAQGNFKVDLPIGGVVGVRYAPLK